MQMRTRAGGCLSKQHAAYKSFGAYHHVNCLGAGMRHLIISSCTPSSRTQQLSQLTGAGVSSKHVLFSRATQLFGARPGVKTRAAGMEAGMEAAAEKLAAFCSALQSDDPEQPGLSDNELAELLTRVPGLMDEDPAEVRAKLDTLSSAMQIPLQQAANLVTKVPACWNRSPEALSARLSALGTELGVPAGQAAALVAAVPPLFSVNTPSITKDKMESLALRLGLPLSTTVSLVTRQPVIWAVPPPHIQSGIPRLCERLGLSTADAVELVGRVPVIISLEERLLNLQVGALSPVLGVSVSQLIQLLGRCLALVAVPAEVLGANISNLASALGVKEEAALQLLMLQPTLLTAQLQTISTAMDALEAGLQLGSRAQALQLLCQQPALLYDYTPASITERIETLATLFQVPIPDVRSLASQQPTLLLIAPYTLRNALSAAQAAGQSNPAALLEMVVDNPGSFMSLSRSEDQLSTWVSRLGLGPDEVQDLLLKHPAIGEMAPTTVKARLESLGALLGTPLPISAQLVQHHPALASIPPNVVITRVKGLSMALNASMQTLGVLVAKAPALLGCAIAGPGELNRDLKPYVDQLQEVVAAYEFYTMDWLQRSMKEAVPQRVRSFSTLDTR